MNKTKNDYMNDFTIYFENALRIIIREEIDQALTKYLTSELKSELESEFITAEEACKFLRISKPTLYNRMRDGSIIFKRLGN